MYRERPPYAGVVNEYPERAHQLGEDFLERLREVSEALKRGGNCSAVTVAYTHHQFSDRFLVDRTMYMDTAYRVALELASLSGEGVDRTYFGQVDGSPIERLQKTDLEEGLKDSNAVWLVSADVRNPQTQEYIGYNHVMGIVPAADSDTYIAMDVSGYVTPLTRLTLDELCDEIARLPVGDNYVQGIISFRDKYLAREEPEEIQEYQYFRPPTEAGRRSRRFPFFR